MNDLIKNSSIDSINVIEKDNLISLNIPQNSKGQIILDWKKVDLKQVEINVGENSSVEVLELSEFENGNVIFNVLENASLKWNSFVKTQGSTSSYHFELNENASLNAAYADFTSGNKTLNVNVDLLKEGSSVKWNLSVLSENEDHKTYNINFLHKVGNTTALMDNYGVTRDKSTLKFLGDAIIEKGAKKASTSQNAKIMVFDKESSAIASPKLCIYENDVMASHGASEGQINKDHVFYLMSRGLSEEEAKRLITYGYLYPIIQYFTDDELKKEIEACIIKRG